MELDIALLFVSTAGSGACLAVLAGREADAAVLGYEMAHAGQERAAVPDDAGPAAAPAALSVTGR